MILHHIGKVGALGWNLVVLHVRGYRVDCYRVSLFKLRTSRGVCLSSCLCCIGHGSMTIFWLPSSRLLSSTIINPGQAPGQVVEALGRLEYRGRVGGWRGGCQRACQTASIPRAWSWSCTGDVLTLSTACLHSGLSRALQPTNPSVEVIIRSSLNDSSRALNSLQLFLCTIHSNSAYPSYAIIILRLHHFYVHTLVT